MKIFRLIVAIAAVFVLARPARAFIDVSLQMQLGNPSGATADTNNHDHYLIQRTVEAIDYSDNLGEPVWASWDLTAGDVGSAPRSSTYYTDTNLPPNFTRLSTSDYNGVGNIDFNRGHLCPSEDRTDTTNDNKLVFFMSNIMPQSGPNNQGVWENLESDCRTLAAAGNELLIICGPSGFGTNKIPSGKAYIGSNVWKIAVIVPPGSGTALSRLSATSRVIAVSIPNVTNGLSSSWQTYLTSARKIEQDTGFTFFTAVPANLAAVLRAKIDGTPAPGITNFSPASGSEGGGVVIRGTNFSSASAVWFNGANASFTVDSASQITTAVPAGAGSGPVSVVTPGGLATSAGNFTVTPAAKPGFQSISFVEGQFSLMVTGASSASYTITVATNLSDPHWETLFTTNSPALPFTFVDTNTALPQRFYRVQNP
ncbi:MAG TPA: DNA/RNA non-specific endonuclease [Candidatus Acidoferrum sp.]|nr:DNA/RNA non-specific endonuclease [Candidatus Acidoferrum sp.]